MTHLLSSFAAYGEFARDQDKDRTGSKQWGLFPSRSRHMHRSTWATVAVLAALALTGPVTAQQAPSAAASPAPSIKRIPLQRFDVPETTYETVIGIAEIAPNVLIGRHTHPGPESGYVIEGGFELLI